MILNLVEAALGVEDLREPRAQFCMVDLLGSQWLCAQFFVFFSPLSIPFVSTVVPVFG
jgi:hypothetical protein